MSIVVLNRSTLLCFHFVLWWQTILACAALGFTPESRAQGVEGPTPKPHLFVLSAAPLPDAPSAQQPPAQDAPLKLPQNFHPAWAATRSLVPGKVHYYLGSTLSVRNLLEAFLVAGVPNIAPPPVLVSGLNEQQLDAYGNATQAWLDQSYKVTRVHVDRLAVGLATAETRQLASNLILPLALHQEARYVPAPVNSDLRQRMWNAVSSIGVTYNDKGDRVPNYSKLGGTVAAAFVAKTVYAKSFNAPELDSEHFVVRYVGYSLLGDLATNAAHELVRAALEPDLTVYNLHGRSTEDSYYPLSFGGKFIDWARSSYSLRPFVSAALIAGLPSIRKEPDEPKPNDPATYNGYPDYSTAYENWGEAVLAWKDTLETNVRYHGRRFGGGLAESETQVLLQKLVIPVASGIDARYIPLGPEYDAGTRLGHTFRSLVEARTDSGGRTVNLPVLLGTAGAAVLAKEAYYPRLGTPALATNGILVGTIGVNLVFDLIGNMHSEFFRHRGY
jgi:hypothetical protein